jgi:hypothetical protein
MAKQSQPTIPVPVSFVHRIAAIGRLLVGLADDLQAHRSGVVVRRKPKNVPKDQGWYWSKQWQEWEGQADEDIAAGRVKKFGSVDDLIADLDA